MGANTDNATQLTPLYLSLISLDKQGLGQGELCSPQ